MDGPGERRRKRRRRESIPTRVVGFALPVARCRGGIRRRSGFLGDDTGGGVSFSNSDTAAAFSIAEDHHTRVTRAKREGFFEAHAFVLPQKGNLEKKERGEKGK